MRAWAVCTAPGLELAIDRVGRVCTSSCDAGKELLIQGLFACRVLFATLCANDSVEHTVKVSLCRLDVNVVGEQCRPDRSHVFHEFGLRVCPFDRVCVGVDRVGLYTVAALANDGRRLATFRLKNSAVF